MAQRALCPPVAEGVDRDVSSICPLTTLLSRAQLKRAKLLAYRAARGLPRDRL